jgi:hypothetical protein
LLTTTQASQTETVPLFKLSGYMTPTNLIIF